MSSINNTEGLDLSFIADFHKTMQVEKVNLVFKGKFNQSITKSVLALAESKMKANQENKSTTKKVFNIMVECLQNISKHSDDAFDEEFETEDAIFLLGKGDENYNVATGNVIDTQNKVPLKELLEGVNGMDEQHLKKVYQTIRKNNMLSNKSGAGLGLIDIARKSNSKLDYNFYEVDVDVSFFTLNTAIKPKNK